MSSNQNGARCSSVVRAFTHGAMSHQIDPSLGCTWKSYDHWSTLTYVFFISLSTYINHAKYKINRLMFRGSTSRSNFLSFLNFIISYSCLLWPCMSKIWPYMVKLVECMTRQSRGIDFNWHGHIRRDRAILRKPTVQQVIWSSNVSATGGVWTWSSSNIDIFGYNWHPSTNILSPVIRGFPSVS